MTRSFDNRERRPGRDEDASAFASGFDPEVRGLGEEALAASHADRVVWSTGHWSADPVTPGCWGGNFDDDASALVDCAGVSLLVNGHMLSYRN
jgi:hypothetical protein